MTLLVVDVSRHQVERADPLDLARAMAAGMGAVNVQLDRGRQQDVLPTWAPEYAAEARRLGFGVSTYRWLDARIPGAESARRAYDRMTALGGPAGMAHVVDCEDTATEQHLRDYVTTMTQLLGRPIAIYTGRWWLQPRGWHIADLSPYLWAAPSVGYLGSYPGDNSPHWTVVYGGYTSLAAMQYAVSPLPGTGNCSLSAIRDPAVWAALTGGGMRARNMQVLTDQIKAKHPGVVIYGIGDEAHKLSRSGHNEDDTPGSLPEDEDADTKREHRAIDVMLGPAFTRADANRLVTALVSVPANQRRLIYVIFDGYKWRRANGWRREVQTGDPHRDHPHISGEADDDENTANWVLDITATPTPQEEDMLPVLIKLEGDPTVRLVTIGVGHIPVADSADLQRWQKFLSDNGGSATVWPWSSAWRPQCGPDLTAQPASAEVSVDAAEVAAALAGNAELLGAVAKAVNDDAHARSAE